MIDETPRGLHCPGYNVFQIKPPASAELDNHPYLRINDEAIHAGDTFEVMLPGCWLWVRLELDESIPGIGGWYIAEPRGLRDVCPIGLFVRKLK